MACLLAGDLTSRESLLSSFDTNSYIHTLTHTRTLCVHALVLSFLWLAPWLVTSLPVSHSYLVSIQIPIFTHTHIVYTGFSLIFIVTCLLVACDITSSESLLCSFYTKFLYPHTYVMCIHTLVLSFLWLSPWLVTSLPWSHSYIVSIQNSYIHTHIVCTCFSFIFFVTCLVACVITASESLLI